MAENKKGYPVLAAKHWWALRAKFKSSIPGNVSANYLASVLGIAEPSARANILPSLRIMGLVGDDGKTTDLAVKWRDDAQYPEVCSEIMKAVYPNELLAIGSDGSTDKVAVSRWFANHTATGQSAVSKMVGIYMVLCTADVSKAPKGGAAKPTKVVTKKATSAKKPKQASSTPKLPEPPAPDSGRTGGVPNLHIDIQVHISSDSTPDQIDQIFSSMAKHLYEK
jgi:hypothetical protein